VNVFYIAADPYQAGRWHCDQHVGKMLLETAQMLSTAHRMCGHEAYADTIGLYKSTHANHPSSQWIRSSTQHYDWARRLATALAHQFELRYGHPHKTGSLLLWLSVLPPEIEDNGFVDPPQCFGDAHNHLKGNDTVDAYRRYYRTKSFARWKHTSPPPWLKFA